MSTGGWIVVAVVVVGIAVAVFFIVRHQQYVKAVGERGWTRDPNPPLQAVLDHQAPPFGLGYERSVDELVSGATPAGFAFRAFDYGSVGGGSTSRTRYASLTLPSGLPDTFIAAPGAHRPGVAGHEAAAGAISVVSAVPEVATAVLGAVSGVVGGLARLDLSIDSNHLVAGGAPKKPEELASFLAALDPVAQALTGAPLAAYAVGPASVRFGFWGRPDWVLVGEDDMVLDYYPVDESGYAHTTSDLIRGSHDGIRMDAFTHHWKEDRTETDTDADGHTTTRTVTEEHDEPVLGFMLPFSLPAISVNGGVWGGRRKFESIAFNKEFKINAEDPKYASDVIHPRMMEWLLATDPRGFAIDGQIVSFRVEAHDTVLMAACEDALRGFLARIPRFVWQNLGLQPPLELI